MKTLTEKLLNNLDKIIPLIIAFLSPIGMLLLAVGAFIVLDTVMGIWKAIKTKQQVTSRKLANILNKMLIYQLVIITFYIVDYAIIDEIIIIFFSVKFLLTKIVSLILISIEIFSIDENWKIVKGIGLFEQLKKTILKVKESKDVLKKLNND